eukprot:TRINITY_DN958_c0_g1_i2.p2 TRINITY_DN958_c0_g1~~TRINITY_DN958_c0_g1_i2.p2  ORF type:complete len:426 (+),score=220.20 TRINITY_DN958_c0_g1_i2:55-1332(+)
MFSRAAMLLGLCASTVLGDNYAVLVAGSNGFYNYRHQADVAHAYQVLTKGGIPKENIITMMYDDVAGSSENPFPGQLFNKPTTGAGWDVYEGVKANLDYTGSEVTADAFVGVLTGNTTKTKGKKVLTSTSKDKVFVNFVDHGGVGIIAFPSGAYMTEKQLVSALTEMHQKQMYQELVFYMEACESGSMFETLPKNISIYALTAANADESSWGTYCPPQDSVNGKEMGSCLGDLFSVNWMENADVTDLSQETLQAQFSVVKQLTNKSHVLQFGDLAITTTASSVFEGTGKIAPSSVSSSSESASSTSSRDIVLMSLHHKYLRAKGAARSVAAKELIVEIQARETADQLFADVKAAVSARASVADMYTSAQMQPACYEAVHEAVRVQCGGYTDYSMKYAKDMKALCDGTQGATSLILQQVAAVCKAL